MSRPIERRNITTTSRPVWTPPTVSPSQEKPTGIMLSSKNKRPRATSPTSSLTKKVKRSKTTGPFIDDSSDEDIPEPEPVVPEPMAPKPTASAHKKLNLIHLKQTIANKSQNISSVSVEKNSDEAPKVAQMQRVLKPTAAQTQTQGRPAIARRTSPKPVIAQSPQLPASRLSLAKPPQRESKTVEKLTKNPTVAKMPSLTAASTHINRETKGVGPLESQQFRPLNVKPQLTKSPAKIAHENAATKEEGTEVSYVKSNDGEVQQRTIARTQSISALLNSDNAKVPMSKPLSKIKPTIATNFCLLEKRSSNGQLPTPLQLAAKKIQPDISQTSKLKEEFRAARALLQYKRKAEDTLDQAHSVKKTPKASAAMTKSSGVVAPMTPRDVSGALKDKSYVQEANKDIYQSRPIPSSKSTTTAGSASSILSSNRKKNPPTHKDSQIAEKVLGDDPHTLQESKATLANPPVPPENLAKVLFSGVSCTAKSGPEDAQYGQKKSTAVPKRISAIPSATQIVPEVPKYDRPMQKTNKAGHENQHIPLAEITASATSESSIASANRQKNRQAAQKETRLPRQKRRVLPDQITTTPLPESRVTEYLREIMESQHQTLPGNIGGVSDVAGRTAQALITPPTTHASPSTTSPTVDLRLFFTYSVHQRFYTSDAELWSSVSTQLLPQTYTSLSSANAQALALINATQSHAPIYTIQFRSSQSTRNEHDCISWTGTFVTLGDQNEKRHHKIWVERHATSRYETRIPDPGTQFLNTTLYILRLCKVITSEDDGGGDSSPEHEKQPILEYQSLSTLSPSISKQEIFTLRDAANRAAKKLQIALSHKKDPQGSMEKKWQETDNRKLQDKVHSLDPSTGGKEGVWESEFNGLAGEKYRLVVEKVRLTGPRNV